MKYDPLPPLPTISHPTTKIKYKHRKNGCHSNGETGFRSFAPKSSKDSCSLSLCQETTETEKPHTRTTFHRGRGTFCLCHNETHKAEMDFFPLAESTRSRIGCWQLGLPLVSQNQTPTTGVTSAVGRVGGPPWTVHFSPLFLWDESGEL